MHFKNHYLNGVEKYIYFQLHFTFNIILYKFQVCSIVVRQPHALQNDAPDTSSTHLAPYIVITILLLYFLRCTSHPMTIL